ncbi:MAG: hypothetical protein QN183_12445 [Armatimonadota bacterium]|nr:hypothetical protein [Armatimonadota bacterium]MDR7485282.1 hypothetical protein [Armatimonadota bacterium]MDR7533880.1 hypothetical protein [Armatimonadota bacterium]MDR7537158.1 hypothetical protein [Armatimonadota bacterium]
MSQDGRQITYDAVLYAVGAVFGDLSRSPIGARFAQELHKEFGRYLAEYLRTKNVTYQIGSTPDETVRNVLKMFLERLEFAQLEKAEPTPDRGTHGVWRDLLGMEAYAALAGRYADPFLSCPLNAVIRYELDKVGHTLRVHGCSADVSVRLLESWEEITEGRNFLTGTAISAAQPPSSSS